MDALFESPLGGGGLGCGVSHPTLSPLAKVVNRASTSGVTCSN
jgi:hypothetical protein